MDYEIYEKYIYYYHYVLKCEKKVYLKNIFHIHPNTPIKYKYKYKYFILWVLKYKYKYKYKYRYLCI